MATTTWNAADGSSVITRSNGDLTASFTGFDYYDHLIRATVGQPASTPVARTVKFTFDVAPLGRTLIGFIDASIPVDGSDTAGQISNSTGHGAYYFIGQGRMYDGAGSSYGTETPLTTINAGDVMAFTLQDGQVSATLNGVVFTLHDWFGDTTKWPVTSLGGTLLYPFVQATGDGTGNPTITADFSEWDAEVAPTLWTPADLDDAKKVGWFDAQDAASITQSGGTVSAWANKFGTSKLSDLAIPYSAVQPVYSDTSFNAAYGGVTFTDDYLDATFASPVSNITAIYILRNDGNGTNSGRFFSMGADADWNYYGALMAVDYGGGPPGNLFWFGQFNDLGEPAAAPTTPAVISGTFKTGADDLRLNGASVSTNAAGFDFSGATKLRVGNSLQGDGSFGGAVAEVIYLTDATADDIAMVEGYAMWRYGLQATLDASHPYRNAAPGAAPDPVDHSVALNVTGNQTLKPITQTSSITGPIVNLMLDPENLVSPSWGSGTGGVTVTNDPSTPLGDGSNMWKFETPGNFAATWASTTIGVTSGEQICFEFYAKAGTSNFWTLDWYNGGSDPSIGGPITAGANPSFNEAGATVTVDATDQTDIMRVAVKWTASYTGTLNPVFCISQNGQVVSYPGACYVFYARPTLTRGSSPVLPLTLGSGFASFRDLTGFVDQGNGNALADTGGPYFKQARTAQQITGDGGFFEWTEDGKENHFSGLKSGALPAPDADTSVYDFSFGPAGRQNGVYVGDMGLAQGPVGTRYKIAFIGGTVHWYADDVEFATYTPASLNFPYYAVFLATDEPTRVPTVYQSVNYLTQTPSVEAPALNVTGDQTLAAITQTSNITTTASSGSVFYVDAAVGLDSNAGTLASPWGTIAKVNTTTFAPGDTVLFKGGQTFIGSLLPQSGVSYGSFGTGRATISSGSARGCYGLNTPYVTVEDLIFVGEGTLTSTTDGVRFENNQAGDTKLPGVVLNNLEVSEYGANGIFIVGTNGNSGFDSPVISNCVAHDNTGNLRTSSGSSGIAIWSPISYLCHVNSLITNCTAYNNKGATGDGNWNGSGIFMSTSDGGLIEHCTAYNNGENSDYAGGGPVGIWVACGRNCTIRFCESYDNKTGAIDGSGFDLDGGCQNCVIEYCYSHGNQGYGFMGYAYNDDLLLPTTGNAIRWNISENDAIAGIMIGSDSARAVSFDVYNNTFISAADCLYLYSGSDNVSGYFANNILVPTGPGRHIRANNNASAFKLRGNDYSGAFKAQWNGVTYNSFSDWATAAATQEKEGATDTHLALTPEFDAASYKLPSASPLVSDGLDLSAYGIDRGAQDYYGVALTPGVYPVGASAGPAVSTSTRPWTPADLPNTAWFDAADATALSWTSKGVVLTMAQGLGQTLPLPVAQSYLGASVPAVRFAVGTGLMTTFANRIVRGVLSLHLTTSSGFNGLFDGHKAEDISNGNYTLQGYSAYGDVEPDFYTASTPGVVVGDGPTSYLNKPTIYAGRVPTSDDPDKTNILRANANPILQGIETAAQYADDANCLVGAYSLGFMFIGGTPYDWYSGDIAHHIICFDDCPTLADVQKFEGWSSWTVKGDGSLLPADHPYALAAPMVAGGDTPPAADPVNVTGEQTLAAITQTSELTSPAALTGEQTMGAATQAASADVPISVTGAEPLAKITQTFTASAPARITGSQTMGSVTQSAAATTSSKITGAQTLAKISQTSAVSAPARVTGAQTMAAATQTAAATAAVKLTGAQTLARITQSSIISVPVYGEVGVSGNQTMPAATQVATARAIIDASATQTTKAITQTSEIVSPELGSINVDGAQTMRAVTQTASASVTTGASAVQTLPSVTNFDLIGPVARVTGAQLLARPTQVSTIVVPSTVNGHQFLPKTTQDSFIDVVDLGVSEVSGDQMMSAVTQTWEIDLVVTVKGTQRMPKITQSMSTVLTQRTLNAAVLLVGV